MDDVRNYKDTTVMVEKCEKNIECKKKGILNLANILEPLFTKSKKVNKFNEMYKKGSK